MTISINFKNINEFNKAVKVLNSKNNDDFLLNVSLNIENEKSAKDIEFQLELNNIEFISEIY